MKHDLIEMYVSTTAGVTIKSAEKIENMSYVLSKYIYSERTRNGKFIMQSKYYSQTKRKKYTGFCMVFLQK